MRIFRKVLHILIALIIAAPSGFLAIAQEGNGDTAASASEESAEPSKAETGITRENLLSQIEEKNRQLEEINKELESSKQNLQEAQKQKQTLQRDLNILKSTIAQLDLNIKSDTLKIQKLGLEIGSLGEDIKAIQASIKDRKQAIGRLLVETQKSDHLGSGLLFLFLRSASLADGFLEEQSVINLQNQLAIDIENFVNLHEEYNVKLGETNRKKGDLSYHKLNLEQRKFIVEDQKTERQTLLTQTRSQESAYQKQVAELEKLKRDIASEVEALGAILRTKIDPATLPPLKPGVLGMPIDTKKENITQDYGSTNFAQYGYRGKWHNGVDIRASIGTPVLAAEDGEVVAAGDQDKYCYKGAYGKFIVINHENNLTTLYTHLSRISAEKDKTVKRGEVIGYSGMTGYATGPHLHFTVFAQPTFYMGPSRICGPMPFGGDLNPLGYL